MNQVPMVHRELTRNSTIAKAGYAARRAPARSDRTGGVPCLIRMTTVRLTIAAAMGPPSYRVSHKAALALPGRVGHRSRVVHTQPAVSAIETMAVANNSGSVIGGLCGERTLGFKNARVETR